MKLIFESKKACIYDDKIIIKRRRKNIIIKKEDIIEIFYAKWSFKNFIFVPSNTIQGGLAPGFVFIFLKKASFFRKSYCFRMKYDDVKKIPKKLCERIIIKEWISLVF